ncbi:MAG: hypothetical protein ACI81R_000086 [Bradymonadia bacterium]|jgi:hypothetical protein
MDQVLRRDRSRTTCWLLAATTFLLLGACEPTPSYLQRWADTAGSEERFSSYLLDSDLTHDVHVKSLELLIEQWDHSSGILFNGGTVKEIEDLERRNLILTDAAPRLRELYNQGDSWSHKMRDASYHLRQGTESPEVRALFDAVLIDWMNTQWDPCRVNAGVVRVADVMNVTGQDPIIAKMSEWIREGEFDRVICFGTETGRNVEWLANSEPLANAYIERWNSGNISESDTLRFQMLEGMARMVSVPVMREWMSQQIMSDDTEAFLKNAILDVLNDNPSGGDLELYRGMLTNESNARWSAFQSIIDMNGSDGLTYVLDNLPADSEYGYYRGAVQVDGLMNVANNIVCVLPKLEELGDNARRVFERYIASENLNVRALSIGCLAFVGDRQSITRLAAAREALGREPVAAPAWGEGMNFQTLIDETVATIQARAN